MAVTEKDVEITDKKTVNELLDDIVNKIWSMPVIGNAVVTSKHCYIISDVQRIKAKLGYSMTVKTPVKKPEIKVFLHNYLMSENYFGAFKTQSTFIKTGLKRGGVNFRIENHTLDDEDKNDNYILRADMYNYAMEHPNKIFITPIRARDGFKPELWSE
jgi:hypothetical protein